MNEQWKVTGSYFEACNCEAACPCVFTSPPTDATCTVLLAWHIERGNFAGVALKDLNVVLAGYSPGHMLQGNWKVALYLDARADAGQQDAMQKIFGGQAGGHLAALGPLMLGTWLNLATVATRVLTNHPVESGDATGARG